MDDVIKPSKHEKTVSLSSSNGDHDFLRQSQEVNIKDIIVETIVKQDSNQHDLKYKQS